MAVAQGVIAALFGLCIGSFLNVIIHRLPRGESLINPATSQCPYCHHPLGMTDLIPIASYFHLRGGCRYCVAPISPRYPLVEGMTAALFILCFLRFGWTVSLVAAAVLCAILVACAFVDLEHMMVLDEILIAGGVVAIVVNVFFSALCPWSDMVLGIAAGALPLLLVALGARAITGKFAMGGGDIKLMAMAGAFLGWQNALLALAFASVGGGLVLLVLLAMKKVTLEQRVPFVPLLAAGSAAALFLGEPLLTWYFGLFA